MLKVCNIWNCLTVPWAPKKRKLKARSSLFLASDTFSAALFSAASSCWIPWVWLAIFGWKIREFVDDELPFALRWSVFLSRPRVCYRSNHMFLVAVAPPEVSVGCQRGRVFSSSLEPPTRKVRKQEENNNFWCCFGLARPLDASFSTVNPFTNQVRHSGIIRPNFRQSPNPRRPSPVVLIRRPVFRIFQNTEEYRICGHLITILFMSDWLCMRNECKSRPIFLALIGSLWKLILVNFAYDAPDCFFLVVTWRKACIANCMAWVRCAFLLLVTVNRKKSI